MKRQNVLYPSASFSIAKVPDGRHGPGVVCILPRVSPSKTDARYWLVRSKASSTTKNVSLESLGMRRSIAEIKSVNDENQRALSEEDDDICPVDCVREFKTDEEFGKILEKAKEANSLVVVDFYRTACGSCKYIEKGFTRLCKGSGGQDASVVFLKHNVVDEYDEQSEVAERLRIKVVPLFHFYKDGVLLEAFPTRDKERILSAIDKYTSTASEDI